MEAERLQGTNLSLSLVNHTNACFSVHWPEYVLASK